MNELYRQWLHSMLMAGIPAISSDTAARILAVIYCFGNNEAFVYNQKFNADREFIQHFYHVEGSEYPSPGFVELLKRYIHELEQYEEKHKNENGKTVFSCAYAPWAKELMKERYGIELIN